MSTCEKISTSKQLPYFVEVREKNPLFNHIEEYFKQDIAPLYGDQTQALKKISAAKDRTSEVLISPEVHEELGVIVYKNLLTNEFIDLGFSNSFEIKTLFVINSQKNSGKRIASRLLRRIAQKAVHLKAYSIFVTVSSAKPESLAFFLSHGFRIAEIRKDAYVEGLDEYYLFNPNPQKLLSTITFELLATYRINTTPLSKNFSERFHPTSLQQKILSSYLSGNSIARVTKDLQNNFGVQVDSTMVRNTIDTYLKYSLKWQSRVLASEYAIVYINPIFDQKDALEETGYLLVGITMDGKRHILGCCPLNPLNSYWIQIFSQLKKQGINKINIICGPEKVQLLREIHRLFPGVRTVQSKALKKWYPENLSPRSNAVEIVAEMAFINEIPIEDANHRIAVPI